MTECFDFYGLTIQVSASQPALVEEIRRDFAYFCVPAKEAQVYVEMRLEPPPYSELPPLAATFYTPRNVCFRDKNISYIDYFGRGLTVFDREQKRCVVYATDPQLVREIVYLFFLSTAGEYLDSHGLHRVHALGVSYRDRGMLLLLPAGGGKSTMALELLGQPGFSLLSEDTPLVDRRGRILPFHQCLGVRAEVNLSIPAQYLRTVQRMEFGPKTLIDLRYFQDRLGTAVDTALILVGERSLGSGSEIVPIARYRAFGALLKYMIVGLGVYQGLEFLLERGPLELLGQGKVVCSRLNNSLHLLARAPTYRFVLGRNTEKNCQTFVEFVKHTYG